MFPLKCSAEELESFVRQSSSHVDGWVSFYWGATAAELNSKPDRTIGDAITAQWLHLLTGNTMAAELCAKLRPSPGRRWWLRNWLHHNWSSILLEQPWAIQLGFTLPAHDSWRDAVRATRIAQQCRKEGLKTLEALETQLG